MSIYSKILIPNSTNESTINTGNRYPKNNAITNIKHGMPSKSGVADNGTSFGLGRQYYFNYITPISEQNLEDLYRKKLNNPNQNIRQFKTTNSTIKSTTCEVGRPIPQNSSDLYLQRKRLFAIGSGSTTKKNGVNQSFNGEDKNTTRQALNKAKAGGTIAPNLGRIGPSQPSIFARHSRR